MDNIVKKEITNADFSHKNILGIKDLSPEDILYILNLSEHYSRINKVKQKPEALLDGLTFLNIFLENSTRTRVSFEIAAKKLGGNVVNISVDGSSIKKGESFNDTMCTLNAMNPDILVLRYGEGYVAEQSTEYMDCPIINAGDGRNEHPTQALLDALTIQQYCGRLNGLNVAICGDIKHSRVARSNTRLLNKMGANVKLIAPNELLPSEPEAKTFTNMEEGLKDADIIMMLRIQRERLEESLTLSETEYFDQYGLTKEKLKMAKPSAYIMHPGPMNRGVEIAPDVADDPERSLILKQVENGVAVRMACLDILTRHLR